MKDQKAILEAYLSEQLAAHGLALDQDTLNLINENVELIKRPSDESQETRAITQKVDSAGKHSAESFKLVNIARLKTEDILEFIGKYAGIAIFEDTVKKIIYAFAMLLIDFYPKLRMAFTEQEAQVIYAIARLRKKAFTEAEVQQAFQEAFPAGLPADRLAASMQVLVDSYVLQRTGVGAYRLREKIKNLQR